jgi:hypothetical protein
MSPSSISLDQFSRAAFEKSMNPARLSKELEAVLHPRLDAASDRLLEAHRIVEDLRKVGHRLESWDESDDFSMWGDDYVNPPSPTRFLIEMRWRSDEEPSPSVEVVVTFGLWPTKAME